MIYSFMNSSMKIFYIRQRLCIFLICFVAIYKLILSWIELHWIEKQELIQIDWLLLLYAIARSIN